MKLRLYDIASQELKALGNLDRPEMFYEYYPRTFPGRTGSMVPFSIRVASAAMPHYLSLTSEALDQLAQLRVSCQSTICSIESDPQFLSKDSLKQSIFFSKVFFFFQIKANNNNKFFVYDRISRYLERTRNKSWFNDCKLFSHPQS